MKGTLKAVLQPARGTRDLLPPEYQSHYHITSLAKRVCETYGFFELSTPIFEFSDVFNPIGETSDIISKETYTFCDRKGEKLTLRPEGTAAVARAVISNGLSQQAPLKYFYAGPMFRYERPQKGRYRQFTQIGCELIGTEDPQADIEVMAAGYMVLKALGVGEKVTLELNSLGDRESRETYRTHLVAHFQKVQKDLSKESQDRLIRNPLRILDSKDSMDQESIRQAPLFQDFLTPSSQAFFQQVTQGLTYLNIPYQINPRLVRGLDYYCHTAFEFVSSFLGAQGTVLAGGRYNGLLKALGGPDLGGVGWGAGVDRLALLQPLIPPLPRPIVLIPIGDKEMELFTVAMAYRLRQQGLYVEQSYGGNLSKRLKKADRLRASFVIMVGEEERKTHQVLVRNLDRGTQDLVHLDALDNYFRQGNLSDESRVKTHPSSGTAQGSF